MSYENDLDVTAFSSPKRAGVISDELLNNLRAAESSNRSWVTHPESGAMGAYQHLPTTVEMLAKKYGKYNPYNEPEARERTRQYLEELAASNKGDLTKTLKQYGGFVKQDATKYIEKILGKSPTDPDIEAFTYKPTQEKEETGAAFGNPNLTRQGQRAGVTGLTSESAKRFEDIATLPYQATVPIAAIAKGVVQSIPEAVRTGQAPAPIGEKIAEQFLNKYQYRPQTDVLEPLQKLPEKILGSSMTPPLPELAGYANAPKMPISPVAQDLAQQFARKATPVVGAGREALGTAQEAIQAARTGVPIVAEKPTMPGVGAATTLNQNAVKSILEQSHPDTVADIMAKTGAKTINEIPLNRVDLNALNRQLDADEFGIKLTAAQKAGDVNGYAREWNNRAKVEELGKAFEEQEKGFKNAFVDLKDQVAPDVHVTDPVQRGQMIIDKLQANDKLRLQDIKNKYKALTDANGGKFPFDGKTFANTAISNLHNDLVYEATPSVLKSALNKFAEGAPMSFENFESLRKITANEMRKGGNEAKTAYIVRQALEDMPLAPEAAKLKDLADQARTAVRNRYATLDSNPAYRAAAKDARTVEDLEAGIEHAKADKFLDKFVINAPKGDVERLIRELGQGTPEQQALALHMVEHLENKSIGKSGDFLPAGFSGTIKSVEFSPKMLSVLGPDAANRINKLNRVVGYTAKPKTGTFNYSNTFSAALGEHAKSGIEQAANIKGISTIGVPVGSMARKYLQNRDLKKSLEPSAGIIKD